MNVRTGRTALLACVLVAGVSGLPAFGEDGEAASWRGVVVPPYPSGVNEIAGTCIGQGTSGDAMCAVSVAVLKDEQSGIRTIIATRRLHHFDGSPVGGDRPLGLVTDALEPAALDDSSTDVAIGLCRRNGQDDARIVAIIRPDTATEWYTRFEGVWRLDDDGRLEPIAPAGIRCLNEGYGYDG